MKHAARLLSLIALLAMPAGAGSMATIQRGPWQLTLRLYNTKVKPGRAPWYMLEMKNVGRNALRVDARRFSLEILDPHGNLLEAQAGGDSSRAELPDDDPDSKWRFWLDSGISTATVAWSDRRPARKSLRHKDDEIPRDTGHTELWAYDYAVPGKYLMRAVYDHGEFVIQTGYAEFEVFE